MAPPGFEPGSVGLKGPYNYRYTKEPYMDITIPYSYCQVAARRIELRSPG